MHDYRHDAAGPRKGDHVYVDKQRAQRHRTDLVELSVDGRSTDRENPRGRKSSSCCNNVSTGRMRLAECSCRTKRGCSQYGVVERSHDKTTSLQEGGERASTVYGFENVSQFGRNICKVYYERP